MGAFRPLYQFSQLILRHSTLRTFLLLAATAAVEAWQTSAHIGRVARATTLPILDVRTSGYTPMEAYELFSRLGFRGRQIYHELVLVDFGNPLVFGSLLAVLAGPLLRRGNLPTCLNLLPFLYSLCDMAENAIFLYLLHTYPTYMPGWVAAASRLTRLKFLCNIPAFGVVLVGLSCTVWQALVGQGLGVQSKRAGHQD